jgi:adenosylhomocysteine nucleosidase
MPVAILAAMEQELRLVEARLQDPRTTVVGGRRCVRGRVAGTDVVTAVTGYGKVSAAATLTSLLDRYEPSYVILGGVAGGIGQDVAIGDVVVADRLVQHDFDVSPIFDRHVIPSLGVAEIATDPVLTDRLTTAAKAYLGGSFAEDIAALSELPATISEARAHVGLIASGDRFIGHIDQARLLVEDLPSVLAVEMEGAAVAQVCAERTVPFAVFRSISDRADQHAKVDFLSFVATVAAPITAGVIGELLSRAGSRTDG